MKNHFYTNITGSLTGALLGLFEKVGYHAINYFIFLKCIKLKPYSYVCLFAYLYFFYWSLTACFYKQTIIIFFNIFFMCRLLRVITEPLDHFIFWTYSWLLMSFIYIFLFVNIVVLVAKICSESFMFYVWLYWTNFKFNVRCKCFLVELYFLASFIILHDNLVIYLVILRLTTQHPTHMPNVMEIWQHADGIMLERQR